MSSYPGVIDTFPTAHPSDPRNNPSASGLVDSATSAILAIEGTLGLTPQGTKADVVTRFNYHENVSNDVHTQYAKKVGDTFTGSVTFTSTVALSGTSTTEFLVIGSGKAWFGVDTQSHLINVINGAQLSTWADNLVTRTFHVDGTLGNFESTGRMMLSGGYGSPSVGGASVAFGAGGANPWNGSICFGDGTGWRLGFGYISGGIFTPTSYFDDRGYLNLSLDLISRAVFVNGANGHRFGDISSYATITSQQNGGIVLQTNDSVNGLWNVFVAHPTSSQLLLSAPPGAGTWRELIFQTAGTNRFVIDPSGNVLFENGSVQINENLLITNGTIEIGQSYNGLIFSGDQNWGLEWLNQGAGGVVRMKFYGAGLGQNAVGFW